MKIKFQQAGFTLIELLIGIIIIGMILAGLSQVISTVLASYQTTQASQSTVPEARYALERMVLFVQESDQITEPATSTAVERLTVSERVSDQYDNASHAYKVDGDSYLDADNDANGLINEGGTDPAEFVTFALDETDASNWKLTEQMPDYSTSATGDLKAKVVLCEHVQAFSCRLMSPSIVEIVLTVQKGSAAGENIELKTTAKSRWVE